MTIGGLSFGSLFLLIATISCQRSRFSPGQSWATWHMSSCHLLVLLSKWLCHLHSTASLRAELPWAISEQTSWTTVVTISLPGAHLLGCDITGSPMRSKSEALARDMFYWRAKLCSAETLTAGQPWYEAQTIGYNTLKAKLKEIFQLAGLDMTNKSNHSLRATSIFCL